MALTYKQEAFISKFIECGHTTEAYHYVYNRKNNMKKATCSNNGYMMLQKSEIKARIKEIKDKITESFVIDRAFLTAKILHNIEVAEANADPSAAFKGLDMLGKMYDLNKDKQNDRLFNQEERLALVENYKRRLINVTPDVED